MTLMLNLPPRPSADRTYGDNAARANPLHEGPAIRPSARDLAAGIFSAPDAWNELRKNALLECLEEGVWATVT